MIDSLTVADGVRSALGDGTVAELRASLVPVDCQTCGDEFIEDDEITLAVDDLRYGVFTTVHHGECRASEWQTHPEAEVGQLGLHVTWRAQAVIWERADVPVILVHPSCEAAILVQDGALRGRWRNATLDQYVNAGFLRSGQGMSLPRPVHGLEGRLDATGVAVVADALPSISWNAPVSHEVFAKARSRGLFVVAVTTAVDPKNTVLTEDRLTGLFYQDAVVYASATVHQPAPRASRVDLKTPDGRERLMILFEVVRRGLGRVPDNDQVGLAMMLHEEDRPNPGFVRSTGVDLTTIALIVAGLHAIQTGPVHVMTEHERTATDMAEAFRRVFGVISIPVSRVSEPSFTPERRVTVGTYTEFEAARARFDSTAIGAADLNTMVLAIDPMPGPLRLDLSRRHTRITEM